MFWMEGNAGTMESAQCKVWSQVDPLAFVTLWDKLAQRAWLGTKAQR